jgi:DNA polymerase
MELSSILAQNFTHISDAYKAFAADKHQCRKCNVFNYYNVIAQSEGNARNPTFMFIGEAFGKDEQEQNRPFIGRAGQRLREEMRKYPDVFNKNSTIIGNVLGCRPKDNKFPEDKDLVQSCFHSWLHRELLLLKPKVIVTLGSHALWYVRRDSGITACRGNWKFLTVYRAWSMATYHPSYVLRCSNSEDKRYVVSQFEEDIRKTAESWSDMVDLDPRMQMTDEEWKLHQPFVMAAEKGLMKPQPVSSDD